MSVTITVNKSNVYNEVAKTTAYSGKKLADDGSAYERVFATDEDRLMLERFWCEAANAATDLFKQFITSVSSATQGHGVNLTANYTATLNMPTAYDTSFNDSISSSLYSFFVNYIVSRWFKFANKEESADYEAQAAAMLKDAKTKLYWRKKPTRSNPT